MYGYGELELLRGGGSKKDKKGGARGAPPSSFDFNIISLALHQKC